MKHSRVDVVVTRHPALVEFLREKGVVDQHVRVLNHVADPDQIAGLTVAGILPHSLSWMTREYLEITLVLPPEVRGRELSLQEVQSFAKGIALYRIERMGYTPI